MKRATTLAIAVLVIVSMTAVGANVILATTDDGERVVLRSDGTWEYLPTPEEQDWTRIVQFISFTPKYFPKDYEREDIYREHIKLFFSFKNVSSKAIAAIAFKAHYYDAFGDLIYKLGETKWSIPIGPDGLSDPERFLYAEKGVHKAFAPLLNPVLGGSLRITITITKIAFQDGTVLAFNKDVWRGPEQ